MIITHFKIFIIHSIHYYNKVQYINIGCKTCIFFLIKIGTKYINKSLIKCPYMYAKIVFVYRF